MPAAAAGNVENVGGGSIGVQMRRKQAALRIGRGANDHRASRVAEQHAAVAVAPVDETAQKLRADDKDAFRAAAGDELVGDAEPEQRAGAGGRKIEGEGSGGAELRLNDHGAGRQRHIGRDRPDDDDVDFFRAAAGHG